MKFDWNYYITRLLARSDSQNLKRDANTIISEFNLLEGQMVEGFRDPSTLEYGLWLSDRKTSSYLEYSPISKSLNRGTIVEESLGMEIFNNIFEIKDNEIEIYKVLGDSLLKIVIKIIDGKYIVIEDIYQNISGLLEIIFSKYSDSSNEFSYYKKEINNSLKEIGNSALFTMDVKTIDTIIKAIRLLPDKEDIKEYTGTDNIYSDIKENIYYYIESLNSKVKRK